MINVFKELICHMLPVLICKHIMHTFFNNINLSVNKGVPTLSKTSVKVMHLKSTFNVSFKENFAFALDFSSVNTS